MGKTTAVILAAGKGTRMRSPIPKVLHEVCGTTLLGCVIEAVQEAGISQIVVVVGNKKDAVKDSLRGVPVKIVEQQEQLGTAHAVMAVRHFLSDMSGVVTVLNGDAPLVKPQTVKRLVAVHAETNADVAFLTACLNRPQGYGRVCRDARGYINGIIEESEASADELKIREINVGMYVFRVPSLLEGLDAIAPHNKKGELYLTDIISIFYDKGRKIVGLEGIYTAEVLGINTQRELAEVNRIRHDEIVHFFMDKGVTIVDPASTFIENHVEIGEGTKVYPFTYICKNVVVGHRCRIGPFAYLKSGIRIENDTDVCNMLEKSRAFFCER